jgi:hypothetical protein
MLLSPCDEFRTQSYGSWMGLMGRVEKNCNWFPTRMSLVAMDTKTRRRREAFSFGLRRPTPPRLGGSRLNLFLVSEDKLRTVNDPRGLIVEPLCSVDQRRLPYRRRRSPCHRC